MYIYTNVKETIVTTAKNKYIIRTIKKILKNTAVFAQCHEH
jgi:hypothetical protein